MTRDLKAVKEIAKGAKQSLEGVQTKIRDRELVALAKFSHEQQKLPGVNKLAVIEIAAASGYLDIVKLLVKPALIHQNKSVNDSAGYGALKRGAKSGMRGERNFWLQDEPPETGSSIPVLHLAAENGYHAVVRLLLDAGLDLNMVSFNSQSGRLSARKTVDRLLKYGVVANATWGQAGFPDARLAVHQLLIKLDSSFRA
ncbi:hypothetical protein EDB81DRAFT_887750 [Dactylonectria macrodidyma]|uniref:Ankyrin repeat domain-containing protein n=1 Tax=Dactylonectria macrodidyma TaxID=307937 RepID=A0A9P9EAQ2_9HYPO|nr:hypothetical protein EDB81DRAFT_887750 [Dactylonectria macrodidyma]